MVLVLERGENERAQALPVSARVPQMLAAGWCGIGTVAMLPALSASPSLRMSSSAFCSHACEDRASPSLRVARDQALDADMFARLINVTWQRSGRLPNEIDSITVALPATVVAALFDAVRGGVDEAALVAWLIVELAGADPACAVQRAALRAARRAARPVPSAIAQTLRTILVAMDVTAERDEQIE